MKNTLVILLLIICTALLAADVTHQYTLNSPMIKESGEYSLVSLADANNYGEPGQPSLPWIGSALLLPLGEEAQQLEVKLSNPQVFTLAKPVQHLQPQYPFSHPAPQPVAADQQIYGTDDPYPAQAHNGINTQFLSGHPINFTAICPFIYKPASGELVFYHNVSITVKTTTSASASAALNLLKEDAFTTERLLKSVDNSVQVPRYLNRTEGFEYIIIYDQSKLSQWLPFKNLYTGRGYNMLMKPVQEITAEYAGLDTQDKIRNYIIAMYGSNSLRHVLFAGDTDVIPHRGMYVNMGAGSEVDADIPADMYYSCLDGNWNTDSDNYWGEIFEGDLAPEISIGRFCYNSDDEIANFINKTNMYLNQPVISEATDALFIGEWLWDGPTWGGDYMDEMIGGSSAHGYTTVGVPTSWDIETLYDRTYGFEEAWSGSQLRPLLSNGPNLVNHLGHSATTYCMRMSNNQVTQSTITNNGTNHNFSIYFTQGCYAGAFDNRDTSVGQYTSDCITEKFTSISTAAAAMISHSRYGWGMQGSTDGASQYIHRQYIDAIFGEDIHELGFTLADSKIDNIPYIQNTPVMYWVTYETNLFGDPGMQVWGATPQTINAQLPSYWTVGLNNYQVQTNAPNASLRIKSGDTIMFEGTANSVGMVDINLLSSLTPGDYDLYIVAPDFLAYHTMITVQASNMPYIVATQVTYNDQDELYHTGEVVSFDLTLQNVGQVAQTEPGTVMLMSNSPNIHILNSSYGFNPLAANESTTISGFFSLRIQGNYADHTIAYFNAVTQFDTYTATTPLSLVLNAPELSLEAYSVDNVSTLVMPGDEPGINLIVNNTGSGNAYNPLLILFSDSPWVTLSDYEVVLSPIGHETLVNYDSAFTMQISPEAPIGSAVSVGYMLGAENGNTLEGQFEIYIGVQNYSFETGMTGWSTEAPNANFTNQWHRSSARNNTLYGSYAMKFGGQGTNDYSNSSYGGLISPEIPLGMNAQLIFNHWMDAETHSNPQYAWDGGLVEISIDGGPWTQISPIGNYPYRIYQNNASPFPANTNVYSGTFDWTQATFDISNYSGNARFRFLFGSDGAVTGEGWYLDDLHVEGEYVSDGEIVTQTVRFELHENYPNPFNPTTTIRFDLPASAKVNLEIYNLKGQRVRTLLTESLAKGSHAIVWNGNDDNGRPVSSGVYLYRLSNGTMTQTRKMMLMK